MVAGYLGTLGVMQISRHMLLLVTTHALAIALGAFATYYLFTRDAMRGMYALGDLSVASMQETLVNFQRDSGTDIEYEAALREYLSVLNRLQASNPYSEDRSSLTLSKMIVLGRIALLAEKRGAPAEAAELMNAAEKECAYWHNSQCTQQKIRELAVYFDKGVDRLRVLNDA